MDNSFAHTAYEEAMVHKGNLIIEKLWFDDDEKSESSSIDTYYSDMEKPSFLSPPI